MMHDTLRNELNIKNITDIILVGFIDIDNGEAQFCPDLRWVYFEFDDKILEFESINNFSKLKIEFVDSIRYRFEIDEDMIKGYSSISDIVLTATLLTGNSINILSFMNVDIYNDYIICDSLKITLMNKQIIFLDPSFHFGIGIGGQDQEIMWEQNIENREAVRVTDIILQP